MDFIFCSDPVQSRSCLRRGAAACACDFQETFQSVGEREKERRHKVTRMDNKCSKKKKKREQLCLHHVRIALPARHGR